MQPTLSIQVVIAKCICYFRFQFMQRKNIIHSHTLLEGEVPHEQDCYHRLTDSTGKSDSPNL